MRQGLIKLTKLRVVFTTMTTFECSRWFCIPSFLLFEPTIALYGRRKVAVTRHRIIFWGSNWQKFNSNKEVLNTNRNTFQMQCTCTDYVYILIWQILTCLLKCVLEYICVHVHTCIVSIFWSIALFLAVSTRLYVLVSASSLLTFSQQLLISYANVYLKNSVPSGKVIS